MRPSGPARAKMITPAVSKATVAFLIGAAVARSPVIGSPWALACACLLATAGAQDELRVEREFRTHGGYVTRLAWSPDGDELAVAGSLGDLVIVDPARVREDRALLRPSGVSDGERTVGNICWSTDGDRLLVSTRAGLVLLNAADGRSIATRSSVGGRAVRIPGSKDFMAIRAD